LEEKQKKADLHTHTYYSDGLLSPSELIKKAKESNISLLSVTDHDNVEGINEAIKEALIQGIEVVPGVELSAEYKNREVHILGYFFDYKSSQFNEYLMEFREQRYYRAIKIVEKLNELKIPLSMEDVLKKVKGKASIGRPHIANALVAEGYISSYYEAFLKYIGDGKPAYIKKPALSPDEAVKIISKFGGLSFLAHPGKSIRDNTLIEIIESGIDGIEVIHPSHSESDTLYFQQICGQYFLLECGGSDFHGGRSNEEVIFGNYFVSDSKINAMKSRLFYG
jgi:3',5'-nucleoside bisphosphate phosphatase